MFAYAGGVKITPLLLALSLPASVHAGAYADKVLGDTPFAYYRLDETGNTVIAADQVGRHPGNYVNSPTKGAAGAVVGEKSNGAISFKKTDNQYIELSTMGNLGSSQAGGYTVEYWLKTSETASFQAVMGVNNASTREAFAIDLNYGGVAGRVRLYHRDPNNNRFESNFYTSTKTNRNVFDGAWHHVVHEYEPGAPAEKRVRMYIDGVRQTNDYLPSPGTPANADYEFPLTLGAGNNRGTIQDFLNGSLDEVAFYKHVLPENAIGAHYTAGSRKPVTPNVQVTSISPAKPTDPGKSTLRVIPSTSTSRTQVEDDELK